MKTSLSFPFTFEIRTTIINKMTITKAKKVLKDIFGYSAFRGIQEEAIKTIYQGDDALVLMPTGGGKSLCYQIPALTMPGTTVVVSPLISLMANQVNALKIHGVHARVLNSSLDHEEWFITSQELLRGEIKLLYVSPEGLNSARLKPLLDQVQLSLIAIDEAHCVSQWGHEFRRDYIELRWLKSAYPDTPMLALTATADQRVRKDILKNLGIPRAQQFLMSFDRPNIRYHIRPKNKGLEELTKLIELHHPKECGIIYCQTRNKVDQTTEKLQKQGYRAIAYHAGLSDRERTKALETFELRDDVIVVATIAFGMGIDKPNVRFVAHLDMPKNIESYYQETGRAGRDGLPSSAWMFYGLEDLIRNKHFLESSEATGAYKKAAELKIEQMLELCETTVCRRQFLLRYFDEDYPNPCGQCDICLGEFELEDCTQQARMFLSSVFKSNERFGVNYNIDLLRGAKTEAILRNRHQDLSVYAIGSKISASRWRAIARNLIFRGYLEYHDLEYKTLKLTRKSTALLKGEEAFLLHKEHKQVTKNPTTASSEAAHQESGDLLSHLRDLRTHIAKELGIPAYLIFSNKSLEDMAILRPENREQFLLVHGVGQKKCETYADRFLDVIKQQHN